MKIMKTMIYTYDDENEDSENIQIEFDLTHTEKFGICRQWREQMKI